MDALICEYEEGTKKESSDMDVEDLPLEEDTKKSNIKNNIYAVSNEYAKKESSENMETLRT